MTTRSRRYEWGLVGILALTYGLAMVDQNSIAYLMPFIKQELQLDNTQVGLLVSVFTVGYAISTCAAGVIADMLGRRKSFLLLTVLVFSLSSVLSSFAKSFAALATIRFLMGLLEGPIVPIAQSIIVLESPVERRGTYMGIVTSLGSNILGQLIAPLLLVGIAVHYGWRIGFFVVILPGLVCAIVIGRFIREPSVRGLTSNDVKGVADRRGGHLREVLSYRNVILCGIIFCFFVAYAFLGWTFLPLYLTSVRQFSSQQMSFLMSVLGVAGLVFGIGLPILSDRVGRKPVMILGSLIGVLCPLACVFYTGPIAGLALLFFSGWALAGTGALTVATIPSESVPARSISTAIGFVIATGFLIGGLVGPTIGGWCADRWGLRMALFLQAACAVAIAVISMFVLETAPRKAKADRSTLEMGFNARR